MSEPYVGREIKVKVMPSEKYNIIACDDLTVDLGREVSSICFYVDVIMPKEDAAPHIDFEQIIKKMMVEVRIPTSKLLGVMSVLPKLVDTFKERQDLEHLFLHVVTENEVKRKTRVVIKGKAVIERLLRHQPEEEKKGF